MNSEHLLTSLAAAGRRLPGNLPVWGGPGPDEALVSAQRAAGVLAGIGCVIAISKPLAYAAAPLMYLAGTYLPLMLRDAARQRLVREIEAGLPDLADLMTVLVEAGVDVGRALTIAAGETSGVLRDVLDNALAEIRLGLTRQAALSGVAAESSSTEFQAFVRLFAEADRYGVPIAAGLRAFAEDARDKELCRSREEAQKLPVKLLFPLVFLILPAFLLLTAGPLIVSLL